MAVNTFCLEHLRLIMQSSRSTAFKKYLYSRYILANMYIDNHTSTYTNYMTVLLILICNL